MDNGDGAVEGGCLCGSVRYVVAGEPDEVLVCHCPDCRRAVGAQSVAWILIARSSFELTGGAPASFESSEGVLRKFCSTCGTTISWESATHPDRIDVTIGSLDAPEQFTPTRSVYRRHKIPWASNI